MAATAWWRDDATRLPREFCFPGGPGRSASRSAWVGVGGVAPRGIPRQGTRKPISPKRGRFFDARGRVEPSGSPSWSLEHHRHSQRRSLIALAWVGLGLGLAGTHCVKYDEE